MPAEANAIFSLTFPASRQNNFPLLHLLALLLTQHYLGSTHAWHMTGCLEKLHILLNKPSDSFNPETAHTPTSRHLSILASRPELPWPHALPRLPSGSIQPTPPPLATHPHPHLAPLERMTRSRCPLYPPPPPCALGQQRGWSVWPCHTFVAAAAAAAGVKNSNGVYAAAGDANKNDDGAHAAGGVASYDVAHVGGEAGGGGGARAAAGVANRAGAGGAHSAPGVAKYCGRAAAGKQDVAAASLTLRILCGVHGLEEQGGLLG
eukprot:1159943-Pelagomonas_calceolata.AAC.2